MANIHTRHLLNTSLDHYCYRNPLIMESRYLFVSSAFHFTEKYAIQLTFIFTKTQYQSVALYDLFVRQFSDMFHNDALISQLYFWNKTLHVSDSSSVHHQEFFTVHTAIHTGIADTLLFASCQLTCMTYITAVCTVKNS